ncbi:carbohydrate porin [Shewanella sp. UCD-KL21]|uniref:carbohydrate porin n=1 Tax=Shewanella sp. UCD-KL21 TaxID=1917164 RepID=UPI0009F98EDE|nr:carbohydrate porin [Shewanella sp. UCD-KL21]
MKQIYQTSNSLLLCLGVISLFVSSHAVAANFESPDSVENTIANQKEEQLDWRESLAADGFKFGADYFSLALQSPNSTNNDSVNAASGVARVYGTWTLWGKETDNAGSLVWKVEQRHSYTDTPPKEFAWLGESQIGYVGMIAPAFSDQGFRVTDLNWKQKINAGKGTIIVGWQDVTNYVDVYALASPWSGFTNLAFSTGAGTMGLPDDGILALSAGHMLGDNFYLVAGVADAKGKSDDIFEGFETLFNDTTLFTTLELGWTASQEQIFTDNIHVTLWHMDAGSRHSLSSTVLEDGSVIGGESGQGINFSWSQFVTPQVMTFVRGGISKGDVALYDKSLSIGFGYFGLGQTNNNLGFAINWAESNSETLQSLLSAGEHQFATELYYNMRFGDLFEFTPDIQYIKDPAFSNKNNAWVFGIRARLYI